MKIKNINGYKKQAGATLLELTMVVGIIAVISIAAISYYNTVNNANKVKDEVNNINSLSASIRNMFNSQGSYEGLENKIILKSSSFPDRMRVNQTDFVNIKNSWLNAGVTVASTNIMGTAHDGFTITYTGVPQKSCFDLLSQTIRHYYVNVGGGAWAEKGNRVDTMAEVDAYCSKAEDNTMVFTTR